MPHCTVRNIALWLMVRRALETQHIQKLIKLIARRMVVVKRKCGFDIKSKAVLKRLSVAAGVVSHSVLGSFQ